MKNAKIAVVTWIFGIDNLDTLFRKIKETGFDGVQFSGDYRKHNATKVIEIAKKYNISLLTYDPACYKPFEDERLNLQDAVRHFTDVIIYAKSIGAPVATIQGLSYWTKEIKDYEEAMQFIIEAVSQLDKVAQEQHITITYEACNHYELPCVQTASELLRIHRESKAKNLMLVLDSFHMNIGEPNMQDAILKTGKLLHSYHISDSGRGGIGTGHIDYVAQYKALKQINFTGYVFFEFVLPEIRPNKFPLNEKQLDLLVMQCKQSMQIWKSIMEEPSLNKE